MYEKEQTTTAPSDQESLGIATSLSNSLWLLLYGYHESDLLLES